MPFTDPSIYKASLTLNGFDPKSCFRVLWRVFLLGSLCIISACLFFACDSGKPDVQDQTPDATIPQRPDDIQFVLLVLIDGVRPDVLESAHTPHMDSLRRDGTSTLHAWSTWPSITLAGIPTVHTGAPPEVHRVRDWQGPIHAETLVEVFREYGLQSALVGCDPILGGYTTAYVTGHRYVEDPGYFPSLAISWLKEHRPFFLFLYDPKPDAAGHAHGHNSAQYRRSIETADTQIGRLLATIDEEGLREKSLVVITTDHGMTERSHSYGYLTDRLVFSIWRGPGVRADHQMKEVETITELAPVQVVPALHGLANTSWQENQVTWQNHPDLEERVSETVVTDEGLHQWDALELVEKAHDQQVTMALAATEPERDEAVFFNTKEWYNESLWPRLFIRGQTGEKEEEWTLTPHADAMVQEGEQYSNFGERMNFYIGRFLHYGEARALFRFDLSVLPEGVELSEAYLEAWAWRLYPADHPEQDIAHHLHDIAPTIAHLTGVRPPNHAVGNVIQEVVAPTP